MERKWCFVNRYSDSPHGKVTGLQVGDYHNLSVGLSSSKY